jgi:predicted DsbA family dithiol-disulfide isomerase
VSLCFYADFACPYCHVENERLTRMGLDERIAFRPVSLLPDAPIPWDPDDPIVRVIMKDGWQSFLERTGDVEVSQPVSLPNTVLAAQAIAEANLSAPTHVVALRTALFRALWVDGRDLGFLDVVLDVWRSTGLPAKEAFSRDARRQAKVWEVEWRNGPYDNRVPVLANDEQQRLVGLPDEHELLSFLENARSGAHIDRVCKVSKQGSRKLPTHH